MAKFNGTSYKLYIGGTGTVIAEIDKVSLEIDRNMIDVTTKDSNHWKEVLPGLKNAKLSVDGMIDFAASGFAQDDIITALMDGTSIAFVVTDSGNTSGNQRYTATGYINKTNLDFPNEAAAKFTMEATITGAVTQTSIT